MKLFISFLVISCSGLSCFATCPSMDVTGDCYVDLEDFADLSGRWLAESTYTDLILLASQWLTGDSGIDKVFIPGGAFQMRDSTGDGYAAELPVHTVALHPFYLGQYEVTNQQYCDYLNSALDRGLIAVISNVVYQADSGTSYPYCDTYASSIYSQIDYSGGVFSVRAKSGRKMGNDPMVRVSWYGAAAYCNWRSQVEEKPVCYNLSTWAYDPGKKGYHLPTEAQWEYAARGGLAGRRFPGGDTISHSLANYYSWWVEGYPYYFYDENSYSGFHLTWNDGIAPYTSPVGSFAANGYGLYDMDGNISEWCNDWYSDTYYNESPETNPAGPATGSYRVLRGGSWYFLPIDCRAASRNGTSPVTLGSSGFVGFRVSLGL